MGGFLDPKPRATLEIPEGAVFEMEADGLVIGFKDDVIIRGNIGHRLKKVWSESGSIELRSTNELVVETVETKRGTVIIAGVVRAKSIKGAKIMLLEGSLSARSVNGEQSIELKGGRIEADLVMSPHVTVTQAVRGRATVIESQNELGPHQLKGGFKMAEFLEMMPSAQKVIQSEASALPQLAAGMPRANPAAAGDGSWAVSGRVVPAEESAASDQTGQIREEETSPPDPPPEGAQEGWFDAEAANGNGAAAAAGSNGEVVAGEYNPDMTSEEAAPEPAPVERPPFHPALDEMCKQIIRVYSAQNLLPPPVARLNELVDNGEYGSVKAQLTTIWNQLIQYHKESKLPFAVKTTQMFQSIQRTLAQHV